MMCEYGYYIDAALAKQLTEKTIPSVHKKDKDAVFIVDGGEGSGKSVFTLQLAKFVDPNFNIDRVCFTFEEYRNAIIKAEKHQAIVFDEAFNGLFRRAAMGKPNKMLVQLIAQVRQKNLFHFIVMPRVFYLERYFVEERARGLFHVYENEKTGQHCWVWFKKEKVAMLKRFKDRNIENPYTKVQSKLKGHFPDFYTIDETEYRKRKMKALVDSTKELDMLKDDKDDERLEQLVFEKVVRMEGMTDKQKYELLKMPQSTYFYKKGKLKKEDKLLNYTQNVTEETNNNTNSPIIV